MVRNTHSVYPLSTYTLPGLSVWDAVSDYHPLVCLSVCSSRYARSLQSRATSTPSVEHPRCCCCCCKCLLRQKRKRRSATQTDDVTYRLSVRPDTQRPRSIGPAPLEIRIRCRRWPQDNDTRFRTHLLSTRRDTSRGDVVELALRVSPSVTRLTVHCWLHILRRNGRGRQRNPIQR